MVSRFLRAQKWLLLSFVLAVSLVGASWQGPAQALGLRALAGRVLDAQNQPVCGAEIVLYVDGKEEARGQSQRDGGFVLDVPDVGASTLRLTVTHPHYHPAEWRADRTALEQFHSGSSIRLPDIIVVRRLTPGFWIATLTFVGVLVLIATGLLHSTMAALLGAAIVLGVSLVGRPMSEGLFILSFEQAIEYVDFDVIFLVLGMMIVVGVIEETGVFQWMAYQAYRLSRGHVWLLVVVLMLLTSVASALLDNVTTMLLVAPITLQIALTLGIDPISLLIPEMLASNVGGISTLIGTPTNILIGSYAGITFNGFLGNLTPGVLMAQLVLTLYVLLVFRKDYRTASVAAAPALLERLRENARIAQPEKLRKAGIAFLCILGLFVFGEQVHLEPAVTAILGAVTMLLVVRADVQEMLQVVDWTTLMFFIALFIVIGTIQEVGLVSYIAAGIRHLVGENLLAATLVTSWVTALLCMAIPTIPLAAALLPVVGFLSGSIPGAENNVLYYSLSIGSALGANSSLVGATNNLVTAGIAERAGYPITYARFLRVGLPAAVVTMIVGTLWLLIRFYF